MGTRTGGSIAGGCIGGGLGGLLVAVLGGWITYFFLLEPKFVALQEPVSADTWLTFLTVNMVLLSLVLAAALVGGVAGVLFGSMLGAAAFSRLHVTPDVNADRERPSGELGWVNGAIYALVAVGLYWAVGSLLWLILGEEKPAATAFTLWALLGVASGVLLSKRARAGQVLGIVFVLPGLLLFPLGTIVGLLLLYALCCDQTRRFLSDSLSKPARL